MKVLVATKQTQGQRKNDFCFCTEGELVKFGMECDGESVDGSCGCKRALCGMDTSKATTTMMVVDLPTVSPEGFRAKWHEAMTREGWLKHGTEDENRKWEADDCAELLRLAEFFAVGAVIEKRGRRYAQRVTR